MKIAHKRWGAGLVRVCAAVIGLGAIGLAASGCRFESLFLGEFYACILGETAKSDACVRWQNLTDEDFDGDRIPNDKDACPTEPDIHNPNGCPPTQTPTPSRQGGAIELDSAGAPAAVDPPELGGVRFTIRSGDQRLRASLKHAKAISVKAIDTYSDAIRGTELRAFGTFTVSRGQTGASQRDAFPLDALSNGRWRGLFDYEVAPAQRKAAFKGLQLLTFDDPNAGSVCLRTTIRFKVSAEGERRIKGRIRTLGGSAAASSLDVRGRFRASGALDEKLSFRSKVVAKSVEIRPLPSDCAAISENPVFEPPSP